MKQIRIILSFLLITLFLTSNAQRKEMPFNCNWQFTGGSVTGETINESVTIPHTWNALDAQEGLSYYRGNGTYEKTFTPDAGWKDQRVFIRFEGVMTIAKVFLNGEILGEHGGGYSAFIFELTDKLKFDQENTIKVIANNEYTLEVLPLFGDFNIYGGIYRPVSLIVAPPICISPLDYASPGIYLKQTNVSETSANVEVRVKISNNLESDWELRVITSIINAEGQKVDIKTSEFNAKPGESTFSNSLLINNPTLWNGKKDAYLYSVKVDLMQNGKIIDSKTEPLGLRYFRIDPNEGFFLNGEHMPLNGVSRHQDRKNKGSAISNADHKEDMEIMLEMGINALRLAHYQHSETIYDLADSAGIVVWAEIPWVGGPGGFTGESNGYEPTEAFHNNAKQQLHELIRQNFNHPSIIFWSIFNEIQNPKDESPVDFIHELNDIVKEEDPSRLSVGASMLNPKENIHDITDAIAWNRYFGWYYNQPEDIGEFLDETHVKYQELCIGISEYGAGGSIIQHYQELKRPNPFGSPHPEEWQSYYHEQHLKAFNARPFVWGTFLWNMFDFGSHFRREGDHYGINDKGLVTFDRKTKKDAFYFFKVNWSSEPVLHITSKRHIFRDNDEANVKVYSNLDSVTLFVNGEKVGTKSPVDGIIVWEGVVLNEGNNGIKVTGNFNENELTDSCVWALDTAFGTRQVAKVYDMLKYLTLVLLIGLVLIIWLWSLAWRKKRKRPKWKRIFAKVLFFIALFLEVILFIIKVFAGVRLG
ncbi:MAG: glycoside hydrolase family 2 TIM barrel-domain containing protein [Bacteroidota bacterium]